MLTAIKDRPRKLIGVRATAAEREILAAAATREHRSVSSFVLRAALERASDTVQKPRRSPEEVQAILEAARREFQEKNPGRDPLAELMEERRAEAMSG